MKQHKQFELIQILRALAIINIYLYHQGVADMVISRWGVCCFFLISGFLSAYHRYDSLTHVDLKGSVRYGIGKIKNLFPLHVVMLVVVFFVYILGNSEELKSGYPVSAICCAVKFILNLFLLSDWVPHCQALELINGEYNIVTWFLSDSLLFFILTPFIFAVMHRLYDRDNKANPYIVMGIIYICVIITNLIFIRVMGVELSFWHVYESPVSRIGDYLIGVHLGYMFRNRALATDRHNGEQTETASLSTKRAGLFAAIVVLNIGFMMLFMIPGISAYRYLASTGFCFTIPVSLLMAFIAGTDSRIQHSVAGSIPGRLLVTIGNLSSYIFLIHYPVITVTHGVLKRTGDVNIPVWIILSVSVTLILSFLWDRCFGGKRLKQQEGLLGE